MSAEQTYESVTPSNCNHPVKRLMFVASLYFKLTGEKDFSAAFLDKVNRQFKLAYRGRALLLPAAMAGLIWGQVPVKQYYDRYRAGESSQALVAEIVQRVPKWARVPDLNVMSTDIKAVFDSVHTR